MPSRRCVVQGSSSVSDISAGISVRKSPIDKTLRAKWKAFVGTHRAQMVASLFVLTILRHIPLKGQSMWMALLEGERKVSFQPFVKKTGKSVIEEPLSKRGRRMVSSTELILVF